MRRASTWLGAGAAALLLIVVSSAFAADVELKDVPEAVMKTAKARFPDIKIMGASVEENEDGETIYEITLDDHNMNIDATFTPEGVLTLIEREISFKKLPKPVVKSLETQYPNVQYRMAEEIIEVAGKDETLAYYEVTFSNEKKEIKAVEFSPEGKVLEVEEKGMIGEEEED
jgi:Putative beta-lactamase-inhibitor-like, PepSY-like